MVVIIARQLSQIRAIELNKNKNWGLQKKKLIIDYCLGFKLYSIGNFATVWEKNNKKK